MFADLALHLDILSTLGWSLGRISVLPVAGTAEAGGCLSSLWASPLLEKLTLPSVAKYCWLGSSFGWTCQNKGFM